MKVQPLIYNIISLLTFVLNSCTQTIDPSELDLMYADHLVVDGMITTERKEHKITLYHSLNLEGTDTPRMETGASVSVSDAVNMVYLTEKDSGEYITSPDFAAQAGKDYTLDIMLANGKSYHASSHVYPSMMIDTLFCNHQGDQYGVYLKAHSLSGAACIIDVYVNDSLITPLLKDKKVFAMGGFFEKLIDVPSYLFEQDTTKVSIRMYSISYPMFQYIDDIKNETIWGAEPFRTLQANVRGNISDDGLGFFCVSDVAAPEIRVIAISYK